MATTSDKIFLSLGMLGSIAAALLLTLEVPKFYEAAMLNGFELPPVLDVIARYYLAVWLLPIAVVTLWLALPKRRWRAAVASAPGLVALVLIAPVIMSAIFPGFPSVSVTI